MSLKNTIDSYGSISKSFHWIMAFIIIANFILGFFLDDIPVGPYKLLAFGIHKSTGILVLGAIILRIVWKGFNQTPMILSSNRAFVILAKSLHHLFYLMFFVIPVSGWAYSSAAGRAVNFYGLFTLPDLVEKNQEQAKLFDNIHVYSVYFFLGMLVIHIFASLYHHFIQKDKTLRRMWFGNSN
jgi:cytochrome b561